MFDFHLNLSAMLPLLKKLVETESPSHDKGAVDRVGSIIMDECRHLKATVEIIPNNTTGNIILAKWGKGINGILLLAHMDTVFPCGTLSKMPFYEKEHKLFGPGISDMKGGIVVALTAVAAALEIGDLSRPITALFTADEEIGSGTSKALIEKLAAESSLVLVLEPGMLDGSVKTWRKGVGEYTIRVRGRAAHAGGDHEKGLNAIEEIAHQVLAIQKMTDYNIGTTLNVGVIRGGIASNVVPDDASLDVDVRVIQPGEAERIRRSLLALEPILDGTIIDISGGLNRPPMPFDESMRTTFEKIKAIAAKENIELKASGTGGASDANFVAPLGIPVLDGLGPAGGEYHSEREFIFKDSLLERVKLLTAILRNW